MTVSDDQSSFSPSRMVRHGSLLHSFDFSPYLGRQNAEVFLFFFDTHLNISPIFTRGFLGCLLGGGCFYIPVLTGLPVTHAFLFFPTPFFDRIVGTPSVLCPSLPSGIRTRSLFLHFCPPRAWDLSLSSPFFFCFPAMHEWSMSAPLVPFFFFC